MPDYSMLKEKKQSCDNNFKSLDIKEKIPGERMGSNNGFSSPLLRWVLLKYVFMLMKMI